MNKLLWFIFTLYFYLNKYTSIWLRSKYNPNYSKYSTYDFHIYDFHIMWYFGRRSWRIKIFDYLVIWTGGFSTYFYYTNDKVNRGYLNYINILKLSKYNLPLYTYEIPKLKHYE